MSDNDLKMCLTRDEGNDVVWGESDAWHTVKERITGKTRWHLLMSGVFKHLDSGRYYRIDWSTGATEMQEGDPFEFRDPKLVEVEEVEATVKQWIEIQVAA